MDKETLPCEVGYPVGRHMREGGSIVASVRMGSRTQATSFLKDGVGFIVVLRAS